MKAHTLHRLLASLYNTPHLADQATFELATSYLSKRNSADLLEFSEKEKPEKKSPDMDVGSGIGVLCVHGALSYKPIAGLCGASSGVSYQSLLEDAAEMVDAGIKTIVMDLDSGGGEGYGVFECATELRKLCDENGVALYAYNDGRMASACYALGCIADEVISNPYAESGSIGVLVALVNDTAALEKEGYARTFITAGKEKIPFAEDGSWRKEFLQDIQTKVNTLYAEFVSHVSTHTGISKDAVKATEAKMFSAKDSLALGLVNKIMTRAEFVSYVVGKHKEQRNAG